MLLAPDRYRDEQNLNSIANIDENYTSQNIYKMIFFKSQTFLNYIRKDKRVKNLF